MNVVGARQASHDRDIGDTKDHYEREPFEDTRSRDSWGYHDSRDRRERLDRDYQPSRYQESCLIYLSQDQLAA